MVRTSFWSQLWERITRPRDGERSSTRGPDYAVALWAKTPQPGPRRALSRRNTLDVRRTAQLPAYSSGKVASARASVARVNPANEGLLDLARRATAVIDIDEIGGEDVE